MMTEAKNMRVITISRALGTGGEELGEAVASALGFRLVTREALKNVFEQYGLVGFESFYDVAHSFWDRFDEEQKQSLTFMGAVIRCVAREGRVVILGRASFVFLQEYADVLNVRLWAPLRDRAARIIERETVANREEVERRVVHDDQLRARFLHFCSRGRADAPDAFDLSINTSKVPLSAAATLIADAARAEIKGSSKETPTTLDITVDKVLDEATREALANVGHFQR